MVMRITSNSAVYLVACIHSLDMNAFKRDQDIVDTLAYRAKVVDSMGCLRRM